VGITGPLDPNSGAKTDIQKPPLGTNGRNKPLFLTVENSAFVGKIFRRTAFLAKADISLINRFCLGIAIAFTSDAKDERGYP
jgi:hypothetical protein